MPPLLEIAVASAEDALAARRADRLELNAALSLGGLTPSLGTLIEVRQVSPLPVIAMARPRAGGFCYSDAEFRATQRDIDLMLAHGADGIAFGILVASGEIDRERVARIVKQVGTREAVFHRAFDVTPDPHLALEQLIDLGIKRVLTSGQEATALEGATLIARLIQQAAGRIEILPGSGINARTLPELLWITGCTQVHGSLKMSKRDTSTHARPGIRFSAPPPAEGWFDVTSEEAVEQLRQMLDTIGEV